MSKPQVALLPDGRRLHLNHGPIDLIIEAWGSTGEVERAYAQATVFFETVLRDLVARLPELRQPVAGLPGCPTQVEDSPDTIAAKMAAAVKSHGRIYVTPMAAVAGAVADGVLDAMIQGRSLLRAYVNNGGDIALYLSAGHVITAAGGPDLATRVRIDHASPVRGIATSGWRGRSHSLGIADAATVLARTAAEADVAATLIANAVDLPGHPAISRVRAMDLDPDSDLGEHPVTTDVGQLSSQDISAALARGARTATRMQSDGLIIGAALWLNGLMESIGASALLGTTQIEA